MKKKPAGRPSQLEAQTRRARLIAQLGGLCAGELCFASDGLEFDHPHGRSWQPNQLSRLQRIARYETDAAAGRLRLLCRSCNAIDGASRRWRKDS